MLRRAMFGLLIGMILVLSPGMSVTTQDAQAWEILELVNDARTANGIPPLAMDDRLVGAAQRHSDDMAGGDFLSHIGSDGSQFWERVTEAGYHLVAGAENILLRWDLDAWSAFQRWRNSPSHNANLMNADYQEIGVAWAVSASGRYYYTMILAARADFVPLTGVPPVETAIMSASSSTSTPVQGLTDPSFSLLISTPTATSTTSNILIPEPPAVPSAETVRAIAATERGQSVGITSTPVLGGLAGGFSASSTAGTYDFSLDAGLAYAILDRSDDPIQPRLSLQRSVNTLLVWPTVGIPPPPTTSPVVSPTVLAQTSIPAVTPALPAPTVAVSVDLRLEYDYYSFAFINVAGRPLFVEGLSFQSASGEMSIGRWDTEYLTAALESFPDRGCLQAWPLSINAMLDPPESCQIRHAWLAVGETQVFWRDTDFFTVSRYGELVAECPIGRGFCEVNLSARLPAHRTASLLMSTPYGPVPPPLQQPADGAGGVRLIYASDSFAIVNAGGETVDLTGLGFSSSSGTMSISEWDTEYLTSPLYAFSPGDCLQVWPLSEVELPAKPSECNWRHAWRAVSDMHVFWINTDYFSVSRYGVVLQTCSVAAGRCEFNLP